MKSPGWLVISSNKQNTSTKLKYNLRCLFRCDSFSNSLLELLSFFHFNVLLSFRHRIITNLLILLLFCQDCVFSHTLSDILRVCRRTTKMLIRIVFVTIELLLWRPKLNWMTSINQVQLQVMEHFQRFPLVYFPCFQTL